MEQNQIAILATSPHTKALPLYENPKPPKSIDDHFIALDR